MRAQSPWPVRYRVTIHPVTGQPRDVLVITWLGPEKAVMMAAKADGRGYGTSNGIYDIDVEALGPADLTTVAWSLSKTTSLTAWSSSRRSRRQLSWRQEQAYVH
jgi:pyruvate/2-oxoglutarate/acetoin dehydrogenase E1 component